MYFWRIESLKEGIISGNLTEKDRFIYAFIYFVLTAIGYEVMLLMPLENGNVWDLISSISNVLIVTVGSVYVYKANGASNGDDFLGKYFSIGFVVTIRFFVYLIPILIIQTIYNFRALEDAESSTSYINVIPIVICYSVLYWRIVVHIKEVN